MSKSLPYFRWWAADAETDERYRAMTLAELGLYHRCLNHSWLNDGIPPDLPTLARVLGIQFSTVQRLWPAVAPCFVADQDRMVNPRQEDERSKIRAKSERASASASHRWKDANAEQTHMRTHCERNARASESESVSESFSLQTSKNGNGTATCWREAKFAEFWEAVWAKIGKDAARKSFERKAKTKDDAERIIAAARVQGPQIVAEAERHDRSVLHPATWLNQGRYDDQGIVVQAKEEELW